MRRNVTLLFVVCVGYGFSKGLFDLAVPLYLKGHGFSFRQIGYIFSISALVIFLLRLYLARLSDIVGRKLLYVGSLALTCLSYLGFPAVHRLLGLAALKTGADLSFGVRETMHATALYESRTHGYLSLQGKTRGVEYACMGLGALSAGLLIAAASYSVTFAVPSAVLAVTTVAFALWFHEPATLETRRPGGLVELLTTAFPREIRVMAISGFIFGVAVSASHHYLPPLFFQSKFGLDTEQIGRVQLVHTLSHVPALFIVGWLVRRRLKVVFFCTLFVEGILLALTGCFRSLVPTLAFWWSHDLIGAGLWAPVQWVLIQRYAREGSRGLDASVVPAVTALGFILGPLLTGYLETVSISLPMIVSGAMMSLAAVPLLWLPPDRPA